MNLLAQFKNLNNTLMQDRLENLRGYTHNAFDKLWKNNYMSRTEAYVWLAAEMNLPSAKAHIEFFDREQCYKVLDIVEDYFAKT